MRNVLNLLFAIVIFSSCSQLIRAQDFTEKFPLLSRNKTFESGIDGWNNTQLTSTLKNPIERSSQYVSLQGVGTWGQTFTVPTGSRRHILNAYAYKRSTEGTGSGGY